MSEWSVTITVASNLANIFLSKKSMLSKLNSPNSKDGMKGSKYDISDPKSLRICMMSRAEILWNH